MQALKALVIFMAILIAIGVTVVGVTIYRRATTDVTAGDKAASANVTAPSGQAGAGAQPGLAGQGLANQSGTGGSFTMPNTAPMNFGSRDLELPAGSEVLSVQTVSLQPGVERVLVYVRSPDGGSRILVLDPLRGTVGGEWRVPAAARP